MTIGNRYHVTDHGTGRSVEIVSTTATAARRKAWRLLGYTHLPFTTTTANGLQVRIVGAVEGRTGRTP